MSAIFETYGLWLCRQLDRLETAIKGVFHAD